MHTTNTVESHGRAPHRVLFVENGIGYGGAIICLRHLVRNLDRSRFEPVLVTGREGGPWNEIAADCTWHHIPDRRIDIVGMRRRLDTLRWPQRIPGARFLLGQVLARLDDFGNFLPFLVQFIALVRRYRPVLIHANNEPLCNRAAILAGRLLDIPVVCHVRGDQRGSRAMRWLYSLPDHFIPVSRWISEGIGKLGVSAEKRTYVYDGIELDRLDRSADGAGFRAAHGVSSEAFAVGLVGLLIPWKGQRVFLEAGRMLLETIPNLQLLIVGGTPDECRPYEAELRALAQAPDLRGRVVFTGHVSQMSSVYNALNVVVSASTSPEPLGTVVIESLALGRPLVAPNHGGAVEMVEHECTGLLFEPGNPASLADMIERFYRDPSLGTRLGEAARAKALATFAVAEHVRRVQEIFESVLARTAAGESRAEQEARP